MPVRRRLLILAAAAALLGPIAAARADPAPPARWAIAVHGGAGVIERADLTPEQDAAYRAAMQHAVDKGSAILKAGGSSLDAIEAVVRDLEDDPLFNAGRGAVFTAAGRNELDAAIMDGTDMRAGSVAGVTTVRHPISLARAVMERSPHVMMIGEGAEAFARSLGLEMVSPGFFFTERRWQQLVEALKEKNFPVPPRPEGAPPPPPAGAMAALAGRPGMDDHRFGTVGVVALDQAGRVAAGTSTGGLTAKQWGRVGDAPVIGAGTWAGRGCAVSATGTGEYFIRLSVARDVCGLVHSGRMTLQQAADAKIAEVGSIGGDGGLIALAEDGSIAFALNTSGMYRASASSTQAPRVAIYSDER
ncbi:MAG: isoaspartyl peptidase/L-asparaginase [Caulobacteraceae bacterium]|nr:isoaspartyl peptidase/L-asparaginase [Caulobacteraceae bacterium]